MCAEFTCDLFWTAYPEMQVSSLVELTPLRWSAEADGGPSRAEIRVSGTGGALADVARMLGAHVKISNELGSIVWWGYVHEVDLGSGGLAANLSLDAVYNKVAVAYTQRQPDNSEKRFTTPWETWSVTATLYGLRELLETLSDGDADSAAKRRDRLLATHARVMPSFTATGTSGASSLELTLQCRGYWDALDIQYFPQPKGLEENASPRKGSLVIGGHYTASTISFATGAGEDNDIRDTAAGLGALVEGTPQFWVSGAAQAANNGKRSVADFENATHIETVERTLVFGAAGPSVTLSWDETKATSVAQSFIAGSSFEVRKLAVRAARGGAPTDNIRLAIWSNSAGAPLNLLAYGGITGSTLSTDAQWIETVTTTGTVLAAGNMYWFVVTRTGAPSLAGYYTVGLDENLYYTGGQMKVQVGGSWVARVPDADLPFRVLGLEDTALQLATMANWAQDQTVYAAVQEISSGIETWQYRAGDRTIQDEMRELMGLGCADGSRLCVQITAERYARIYKMPTQPFDAYRPVLGADGKLGDCEPGVMVAGRWVRLGEPGMQDAIGQDMVFVERCEYDAETDSLSVEGESTISAWRAIGNRRG